MSDTNHSSEFRLAARVAILILMAVLSVMTLSQPTMAQNTEPAAQPEEEAPAVSESPMLLEDVVVTAQKREQLLQDVPVAVTAFDAEQLDALKVRDLTSLSIRMPNVSLDDVGTVRGIANFSIRGLGINSSIPGIDPTVGVFIDGVYMGTNATMLYEIGRASCRERV